MRIESSRQKSSHRVFLIPVEKIVSSGSDDSPSGRVEVLHELRSDDAGEVAALAEKLDTEMNDVSFHKFYGLRIDTNGIPLEGEYAELIRTAPEGNNVKTEVYAASHKTEPKSEVSFATQRTPTSDFYASEYTFAQSSSVFLAYEAQIRPGTPTEFLIYAASDSQEGIEDVRSVVEDNHAVKLKRPAGLQIMHPVFEESVPGPGVKTDVFSMAKWQSQEHPDWHSALFTLSPISPTQ